MDLQINKQRAVDVVLRLYTTYKNNEGIFKATTGILEKQIPSIITKLSKEHALFLLYLISVDYGTKSSALYKKAIAFYEEMPNFFNPWHISRKFNSDNIEELSNLLSKKLGVRYPNEAAKKWYKNSIILINKYGGDPRRIFYKSEDARKVVQEIKKLYGFGPKIGNLLLRVFIGCGFVTLKNIDQVLPPVDIHDVRIAFNTEIVKLDSGGKIDLYKFVPHVQKIWLDACNAANLNWLEIDRALWIIGSVGCATGACHICPLDSLCKKDMKMFGNYFASINPKSKNENR